MEKLNTMLFRHKAIFWISLTLLLLGLFQWLYRMAMPEVAFEFAAGTTIVIVSGLFLGYALTKFAIRTNAIRNPGKAIVPAIVFSLIGFVAIAFLLNAMIEKTTLFPFAITVLLVFLVNASVGCLVTVIRQEYKTKIVSANAALAQSKSELQLLQSQLSPHFLFNTLNNLYGLSITEPQRLPPLLLQLSDLLRYSIYDVKEIFVPLQHEIDYIRNYVDFERLRLGDRLQLTLDIEPAINGDCKVPPLMLIVFIENAFKHSRAPGQDKIRIEIMLGKRGKQIVFSARNSMVAKSAEQSRKKHSGFGLDSVRKRLDLLYPGRHKLHLKQTENDYEVHLELECQRS